VLRVSSKSVICAALLVGHCSHREMGSRAPGQGILDPEKSREPSSKSSSSGPEKSREPSSKSSSSGESELPIPERASPQYVCGPTHELSNRSGFSIAFLHTSEEGQVSDDEWTRFLAGCELIRKNPEWIVFVDVYLPPPPGTVAGIVERVTKALVAIGVGTDRFSLRYVPHLAKDSNRLIIWAKIPCVESTL
jgi:hypothetical protein